MSEALIQSSPVRVSVGVRVGVRVRVRVRVGVGAAAAGGGRGQRSGSGRLALLREGALVLRQVQRAERAEDRGRQRARAHHLARGHLVRVRVRVRGLGLGL